MYLQHCVYVVFISPASGFVSDVGCSSPASSQRYIGRGESDLNLTNCMAFRSAFLATAISEGWSADFVLLVLEARSTIGKRKPAVAVTRSSK